MAGNPLHTVLDHLRRLHRVADRSQQCDGELLRAFVVHNDQDAFAAVVTRHAPLVWGVCRRILGHQQDAEDAFQATFLVLARRAGSIRSQTSIGNWLHTVAQRLAVRARKQTDQRRIHEQEASRMPPADASLRELAAVVDEELQRLPAKYREALLLHYLEGATAEAAARQLGLSRTVFYNRLAHGRELLRERLSRQGLSLAAPLLAAALTPETEAASRSLIQKTIRCALESAPERVAILAADVVGTTAMAKLKIGLALGLLLVISAGGLAMLTPLTPLPQAERPADPPKTENKSAVRVDRYGDPLPPGAVARLGTLRFRLDAHRIEHLAFAPDGETLAGASHRGVTLFDLANGKQTKVFNPSANGFTRLAYSPDGKRLMTHSVVPTHVFPQKTIVQIWEVDSGRKISEKELQYVCWLGWSPEGQPQTACLGRDEIVYHELGAGRTLHLPAKHLLDPSLVGHCRCAAAKNLLTASGADGKIHIWDLINGKELLTLQPGLFVTGLALSADSRRLASVARDAANKYRVQVWDTATGKVVRTFPPGREVLFAADGTTLAVTHGAEIRFWDTDNGREVSSIRAEHHTFGQAIAFTPDSKTFATTGWEGGAIQLWNVADGKPKPQPQGHSYHPIHAAFSPDGKRVATCAFLEGTIRLWDSANGEPLIRIQRSGWARNCAFSADGGMLYSCSTGDKLYFDDAASGRERSVHKVEDPDRPKFRPSGLDLHLADDGTRLTAFHTDDNRGVEMLVTVWDVATRKQLLRRRRVNDAYWNVLSADGRKLAAAHADSAEGPGMFGKRMGAGPMYLEDLGSGEKMLTFPVVAGQTAPMAFSPDGRLLISYTDGPQKSGERGVTLRLWEVLTAAELRAFPTVFETKGAFTSDGRLLAMPASNKEILIWDLSQDKAHQRFRGFGTQLSSLTFSPNGRRLVSGHSDSTLLVWDVAAPSTAPAARFGADDAAKAWADLAGADAPRAFRARWILASVPEQAIPLLRKYLHPTKAADAQRLHRLLADLDGEQFAVREKAQNELVKLGDLAESALRQTLANKPSLEMRQRVQAVLERLRGPVTRPELLQALRAAAVLEDIGTPEARVLLAELTKGAAESRLTREAKESLRRLNLRSTIAEPRPSGSG